MDVTGEVADESQTCSGSLPVLATGGGMVQPNMTERVEIEPTGETVNAVVLDGVAECPRCGATVRIAGLWVLLAAVACGARGDYARR